MSISKMKKENLKVKKVKKMNKLFSTAGFELHRSFGSRITDL